MIMGAMVGADLRLASAPPWARLGLGLYGAVTGACRWLRAAAVAAGRRLARPEAEAELEREIESEVAKRDELEEEIEAELGARRSCSGRSTGRRRLRERSSRAQPADRAARRRASIRAAPRARRRSATCPPPIFEEDQRKVPKGKWGNDKEIDVEAPSLDADRDGEPEEVRYVDPKTGVLLFKEEDRDYDGRMDSWTRYEGGLVAEIQRDTDGDGKVDEWQSYGARRPDGARARSTATPTA